MDSVILNREERDIAGLVGSREGHTGGFGCWKRELQIPAPVENCVDIRLQNWFMRLLATTPVCRRRCRLLTASGWCRKGGGDVSMHQVEEHRTDVWLMDSFVDWARIGREVTYTDADRPVCQELFLATRECDLICRYWRVYIVGPGASLSHRFFYV